MACSGRKVDYHAAILNETASRFGKNRSTDARTTGRAFDEGSAPRNTSKKSGSSMAVEDTHASESTA